MAGREPTLAEIIDRAITSRLNDLFAPMPAIVQTFYPATVGQAAAVDALPVVQRALPVDDDGTLESEPLPVVPNVPLVYPRGGGFALSWDLLPGDTVLLVPLFLAITQWRLTGLPINAPVTDQGLHHLGNCVAIPGLIADVSTPIPNPNLVVTLAANNLTLTLDSSAGQITFSEPSGSSLKLAPGVVTVDGASILIGASASDFAALSSKVDNELQAIKTTFTSAVAPGGGGPVTYGHPYNPAGSVAASKTQVE